MSEEKVRYGQALALHHSIMRRIDLTDEEQAECRRSYGVSKDVSWMTACNLMDLLDCETFLIHSKRDSSFTDNPAEMQGNVARLLSDARRDGSIPAKRKFNPTLPIKDI